MLNIPLELQSPQESKHNIRIKHGQLQQSMRDAMLVKIWKILTDLLGWCHLRHLQTEEEMQSSFIPIIFSV